MIQLDFLEPLTEVDIIRKEMKMVKDSCDKVRRGIFARHNELAKLYIETKERLDLLESHICKNRIHP